MPAFQNDYHHWLIFLDQYADEFVICRFGDDRGFKTSTLTSPKNIRNFIFPQYKRVIDLIKGRGKPFLWHSCGKIFSVMEAAIALGIDTKHSNEDAIAPYEDMYQWKVTWQWLLLSKKSEKLNYPNHKKGILTSNFEIRGQNRSAG